MIVECGVTSSYIATVPELPDLFLIFTKNGIVTFIPEDQQTFPEICSLFDGGEAILESAVFNVAVKLKMCNMEDD